MDLIPLVCWVLGRVWLFATPWIVVHQTPLPMGFPRQEHCGGLPWPPINRVTKSSALSFDLFHGASCPRGSRLLQPGSEAPCFRRLNDTPLLLVHARIPGPLGCFHSLAVVNKAAMISLQDPALTSFQLRTCPEVELLDPVVALSFWRSFILFSVGAAPFYVLTSSIPGFHFLHIPVNIWFLCFFSFDSSCLLGARWCLIVVLIRTPLLGNDAEHLFKSSLAICVSFLGKCLSSPLLTFFIMLFAV